MKNEFAKLRLALVGPGRVGQALGKLLAESGVDLTCVAARRLPAARKACRFIGAGKPVALDSPELASADVLLLTTSDSALPSLAQVLAARKAEWKGKIVLHTSGSLPGSGRESVLAPLKKRGAATGSLHPYQTIPSPLAGTKSLRGCFWGVEGDPAARKIASRWIRSLEGIPFPVRPSQKILYHASAFLVCPTMVTLMDQSHRLLRRAGVPEKVIRPMLGSFVGETVRNFMAVGARKALTGPASRGDWGIIAKHLRALRREAPAIVPLYLELLRAMLRLAGRRPSSRHLNLDPSLVPAVGRKAVALSDDQTYDLIEFP